MLLLNGPREKVSRAKLQIIALQRTFEGFFKDNAYQIGIAEYNRKTDCYSLRVQSGPEFLPPVWSVIIGEIAHNLRSALDGLVWQLALDNKKNPYARTAFPIYLLGRTHGQQDGRPHFWSKRHGMRLLKDVNQRYWTRIESFQPYKRGNGYRRSPLFLLEELNNTDKHRLITVLAPNTGGMRFTGFSGGTRLKLKVPLRLNAKVGEVRDVSPPVSGNGGVFVFNPAAGELEHPKLQANVTVSPGIRFGNTCKAVERMPVISTLQLMADQVSSIIESFSDDLQG